MEIIDKILQLLNERGISQKQLEIDGIVKQSTFTSWKNGSQPALDKIIKIIQYFELTPNELFGYPDNTLSDNDKELLELFHQLPEREQIKLIGRVEELVNKYKGE